MAYPRGENSHRTRLLLSDYQPRVGRSTLDTSTADLRRLRLPGAHNLRYVAGSTADGRAVRDRLLWRSNALNAIDGDARLALRREGIRTVVDLREDDQRRRFPNALDGVGATIVGVPIFDGTLPRVEELGAEACRVGDLTPIYQHMVRSCGRRIAAAISHLARPRALPAIVNCSAGKDRTGIVVAFLLDAIGVVEDDIIDDFVLTERYRKDAVATTVDRVIDLGPRSEGAEPGWLEDALRYARETHGGAAEYLAANGLDGDSLTFLRETLLVGTPPVHERPGQLRSVAGP